MSRWREISPFDVAAAGMRAGLYVVYLDRVPAYIGSAGRLARRLRTQTLDMCAKSGLMRGQRFVCLRVKVRNAPTRAKAYRDESALIRRLRPSLNVKDARAANRKDKTTNCSRAFAREMHLQYG